MMDEHGNGWPTWSQMNDTGKGIVIMVVIFLIVTLGQLFY